MFWQHFEDNLVLGASTSPRFSRIEVVPETGADVLRDVPRGTIITTKPVRQN